MLALTSPVLRHQHEPLRRALALHLGQAHEQVENQAIDESPLRVSRINAFQEAEESAS
jgi:hypothetical protein